MRTLNRTLNHSLQKVISKTLQNTWPVYLPSEQDLLKLCKTLFAKCPFPDPVPRVNTLAGNLLALFEMRQNPLTLTPPKNCRLSDWSMAFLAFDHAASTLYHPLQVVTPVLLSYILGGLGICGKTLLVIIVKSFRGTTERTYSGRCSVLFF